MRNTIIQFDMGLFMQRQYVEALTCPVNRHCTREERNCDDWELFKNPGWLLKHFIENGGAVEFAKRRAEFCREIEVFEIEFEI